MPTQKKNLPYTLSITALESDSSKDVPELSNAAKKEFETVERDYCSLLDERKGIIKKERKKDKELWKNVLLSKFILTSNIFRKDTENVEKHIDQELNIYYSKFNYEKFKDPKMTKTFDTLDAINVFHNILSKSNRDNYGIIDNYELLKVFVKGSNLTYEERMKLWKQAYYNIHNFDIDEFIKNEANKKEAIEIIDCWKNIMSSESFFYVIMYGVELRPDINTMFLTLLKKTLTLRLLIECLDPIALAFLPTHSAITLDEKQTLKQRSKFNAFVRSEIVKYVTRNAFDLTKFYVTDGIGMGNFNKYIGCLTL
jgi:hypothetical protein